MNPVLDAKGRDLEVGSRVQWHGLLPGWIERIAESGCGALVVVRFDSGGEITIYIYGNRRLRQLISITDDEKGDGDGTSS